MMKNVKIVLASKALISFLLLIMVLSSGVYAFHSLYYESVFIAGISMAPTLNGAEDHANEATVDFGIIDNHKIALKHIKRFDIVSTYYPDETDYDLNTNTLKKDARKKIKRVIALPNETFEIKKGLLYVLNDEKFELVKYPFKTIPEDMSNFTEKDTGGSITLAANEYWVLGDNRQNSHDSATINKPVKYSNLLGVLVAIEGKGTLYIKHYRCSNCEKKFNEDVTVCDECGNTVLPIYDLKNKQYIWPKYF